MRKLRIRTHFLFGLVLLLLLPWVFFVVAHLITTQSLDIRAGRPHTIPMFAAFAGLLLAFFIIGMQMQRLLLLPLERLSRASRQIAAGDWDVQLPHATIREIVEVHDSFEVMVNGLQRSHMRQTELEEERRYVIAAVAHDLRTPLFALRGYLDGLEQGIAQTPDQMTKYVSVCKEKTAQLDRLVEELFTFTKIEYQEAERSEKTADFHNIVQKSIDSIEPQAQQKPIAIVTDHASDNCMIHADSHLLERAISNLLDNAVRYTSAYGKIFIQYRREGDRITFTIHDSGPGFALEDLQRIFEPLYRGEQSRNRATGGAGLGLTISRRIIRQHGGELTADNHPGGGAVLSGYLPAVNR
ncbi:sensor histidine kinase [Desmospora activa]|uniref:histidine kinase n=1 Tax=Desmospora activa DSM 45169 TaxID=1121389 RepID=A0A2T4Z7Y8_9BACL|nr:HAMP domain-containing sensor histidine kinase [Desmospora activa]PTM58003.1 HAMP domain-containing protein [Desmospora activa DSM 45169]